jgi:hypothetical protein
MFFDLLPTLSTYIFHVTIQLFATQKSDQNPDPDPHENQCGFTTLLAYNMQKNTKIYFACTKITVLN